MSEMSDRFFRSLDARLEHHPVEDHMAIVAANLSRQRGFFAAAERDEDVPAGWDAMTAAEIIGGLEDRLRDLAPPPAMAAE